MEFNHIPVLLNETIEGLNIKENGIYADGTAGGGGHSSEILKLQVNLSQLTVIPMLSKRLQSVFAKMKIQ